MLKFSLIGYIQDEIEDLVAKKTIMLVVKRFGVSKLNEVLAEIFHDKWQRTRNKDYNKISEKYDQANTIIHQLKDFRL